MLNARTSSKPSQHGHPAQVKFASSKRVLQPVSLPHSCTTKAKCSASNPSSPAVSGRAWNANLSHFYLHPTIAYSLGGKRPLPAFPAPLLGQHTAEVLAAMGYDDAALAEFAAQGITGRLLAGAAG